MRWIPGNIKVNDVQKIMESSMHVQQSMAFYSSKEGCTILVNIILTDAAQKFLSRGLRSG